MKIRSLGLAVALAPLSLTVLASPLIEEEVVVTASHLPISPLRSASALTVIDADEIRHRAPIAVSDLLRSVPGLAVSRNGVLGSSTQIRARGAEGNHLLVLIDGVEANDPSQGDEVNWGTLTAADIERIEVVRGPQSALYGSDAIAGVVNIITKSARAPWSAAAFTEAGSFNTQRYGVDLGHRSETYNVRLGISDVDSDGDNISRSGGEDDGYRNTTYSLKGGWTPAENLALTLVSRQQDGRNEFDGVDSLNTGLPRDADRSSEFRNRITRVEASYRMLDGAWLHRLGYAHTESDNENFNTGVETGSTASEKNQFQYLTALQWADDAQSLSLLLETEEEDFRQRGPVTAFGDDPNQDLSRDTDSVAAEYRGTFMEALTLAASARYDDNSEFEDATTHKLEASYLFSDATRLRAAWGTGVKNPTFTERFGYYASSAFFPFIGNPELEPEESESWEVGVDQALLGERLDLSLTLFKVELENEINGFHFDPVLGATTAVNIDGESERQGAELGLRAELSDRLGLTGAYTYTDSTQENAATGCDVDELRRARHIASATLDWQALETLQINLNLQYNGSQDDQFYPPWPQPSRIIELDDYTLVNLNATWNATANLELYGKVENLLDEQYEEVYGFATQGVGAYLGARYRFAR